MKNDVTVVIPAYNEGGKICEVIYKVRRLDVVVVDDGSSDNTGVVARKSGVTVLTHIINLGKGAALKTGCDYAVKKGAKNIIVMDSDGQHDPLEIPRFVRALEHSDVVLGYRRLNHRMPYVFRFGNWFINTTQSLLFRINVRDTQCGFRAFTSQAYKKIRWNATDYSMESEMVANIGRQKLKYVELPIKTIYSDKYKGTTIIDGIRIVMNMIMWRLRWRG